MKTLGVAVNALQDWDSVAPTVAELGAKHASYGARPEDYATVGAALLQTLATGLGEAFTDEVAAAWAECFEVVASTMLAGQHRSEEHTSELQSLMRSSYAVFCWTKKNNYVNACHIF